MRCRLMEQIYSGSSHLQVEGKSGEVVLDQMRAVDKGRLVGKMIDLDPRYQVLVCDQLQEMFAY